MKHHVHHKLKTTPLGVLVMFVSVTSPIMTSPQAYTIWRHKQAENISLSTWGFYLFASCVWLVYGLKNKIKPIILNAALWMFFEGSVVLGILLYG